MMTFTYVGLSASRDPDLALTLSLRRACIRFFSGMMMLSSRFPYVVASVGCHESTKATLVSREPSDAKIPLSTVRYVEPTAVVYYREAVP